MAFYFRLIDLCSRTFICSAKMAFAPNQAFDSQPNLFPLRTFVPKSFVLWQNCTTSWTLKSTMYLIWHTYSVVLAPINLPIETSASMNLIFSAEITSKLSLKRCQNLRKAQSCRAKFVHNTANSLLKEHSNIYKKKLHITVEYLYYSIENKVS